MTKVLIEGGRTVDTADYFNGDTIGSLADGIAGDTHGLMATAIGGEVQPLDRQFSLKVGGHLLHPTTPTADVALHDGNVIELVEVTDQHWPGDEDDTTLEVGVPHDAAGELRVEVPTGTVDELIEWVGEDVERAKAVIDVELLQDEPRTTLLHHLRAHFDLPDDDDNAG